MVHNMAYMVGALVKIANAQKDQAEILKVITKCLIYEI